EIEDIQRAPRRPEPQPLSPRDEDLPTWAAHPGCLPRRAWDRPQGEPFKESPTTAGVAALPDWARQEEQIEVGCKPRKTWSRKPPRDDDSDQPTGMTSAPKWAHSDFTVEVDDTEQDAGEMSPEPEATGLNLPSWVAEDEARARELCARIPGPEIFESEARPRSPSPEPETFTSGLLNLPSWAAENEQRPRSPRRPEPASFTSRIPKLPGWAAECEPTPRSPRRPEPASFTTGIPNLPGWAAESEPRPRPTRRPRPEAFGTGIPNLPGWTAECEPTPRSPRKPEPASFTTGIQRLPGWAAVNIAVGSALAGPEKDIRPDLVISTYPSPRPRHTASYVLSRNVSQHRDHRGDQSLRRLRQESRTYRAGHRAPEDIRPGPVIYHHHATVTPFYTPPPFMVITTTGIPNLPGWAAECEPTPRSPRRPEPASFTSGIPNLPGWGALLDWGYLVRRTGPFSTAYGEAPESESRPRQTRRLRPETFTTGILNLPSWAAESEPRSRPTRIPQRETFSTTRVNYCNSVELSCSTQHCPTTSELCGNEFPCLVITSKSSGRYSVYADALPHCRIQTSQLCQTDIEVIK
ncbi:hypothetical protein J6590_097678, partial [Homalodisca vitripennis]